MTETFLSLNDSSSLLPKEPLVSPESDSVSIKIDASSKKSLLLRLIIFGTWCLIVYIVFQFVTIYMLNKPRIKWWTEGGQTYHRYFSMWLFLAEVQGSGLMVMILRLFLSESTIFTREQNIFLSSKIFGYIRTDLRGTQTGILTPRSLCETILLTDSDGDVAYSKWLKSKPKGLARKQPLNITNPANSEEYYLTFQDPDTINGVFGTYQDYTGKHIVRTDKEGGNWVGVYPEPSDGSLSHWKGCMQAWANGGIGANKPDNPYVWKKDPTSSMFSLQPLDDSKPSTNFWFSDTQPDNVFQRYGILPNSPLITSFANNKAYLIGVAYDWNNAALWALMRKQGDYGGGWVGFLNSFSSKASPGQLDAYVSSSVDVGQKKQNDGSNSCGDGQKYGNAAIAGASSFGSTMIGVAMLGNSLSIIIGTVFAALLAVSTGHKAFNCSS